ncbi:MAG TPA: DUF6483 family protein, partial [Pseudoflavonifractor sp.]|nr:DUF6483 family protein [Pseudoflavonifractor sp.]
MLTQDWIMRRIETLTLTIAKLIFQKDTPEYRPGEDERTDADALYTSLLVLTGQGQYSDGENLLFDTLDEAEEPGPAFLDVANDFYARLNLLSDQELAAGGFSRQEIEDG